MDKGNPIIILAQGGGMGTEEGVEVHSGDVYQQETQTIMDIKVILLLYTDIHYFPLSIIFFSLITQEHYFIRFNGEKHKLPSRIYQDKLEYTMCIK